MNKYLRLFIKQASMQLSSLLNYKVTLILTLISDFISIIIQPLIIVSIYNISNGIPGWSASELILFNAITIITLGITNSLIIPLVWNIGWRVNNGYLDLMLLKPLKIIPQMIITSFNPWWITDILIGLIMFLTVIITQNINITISSILIINYFIILSLMVFYEISGTLLGLSFKHPKAYELLDVVLSINELTRYPISIYKGIIPLILTFIIPISVTNYYPASFLLGKINDYTLLIILTIISILFTIIGTLMIKLGLRNYSSSNG